MWFMSFSCSVTAYLWHVCFDYLDNSQRTDQVSLLLAARVQVSPVLGTASASNT